MRCDIPRERRQIIPLETQIEIQENEYNYVIITDKDVQIVVKTTKKTEPKLIYLSDADKLFFGPYLPSSTGKPDVVFTYSEFIRNAWRYDIDTSCLKDIVVRNGKAHKLTKAEKKQRDREKASKRSLKSI